MLNEKQDAFFLRFRMSYHQYHFIFLSFLCFVSRSLLTHFVSHFFSSSRPVSWCEDGSVFPPNMEAASGVRLPGFWIEGARIGAATGRDVMVMAGGCLSFSLCSWADDGMRALCREKPLKVSDRRWDGNKTIYKEGVLFKLAGKEVIAIVNLAPMRF